MNILTHLLLVASLAALSLAACTDDVSDSRNGDELDLVRIEIEVVGSGTVIVEADEIVRCSADQGLCSFSYARGTPLAIYAAPADDASSDVAPTWQDACVGYGTCAIILDRDEVVVANFDDSISNGSGQYDGPNIIIDPIPNWYRSYAQQDGNFPTSARDE